MIAPYHHFPVFLASERWRALAMSRALSFPLSAFKMRSPFQARSVQAC